MCIIFSKNILVGTIIRKLLFSVWIYLKQIWYVFFEHSHITLTCTLILKKCWIKHERNDNTWECNWLFTRQTICVNTVKCKKLERLSEILQLSILCTLNVLKRWLSLQWLREVNERKLLIITRPYNSSHMLYCYDFNQRLYKPFLDKILW